MQGIMETIFDVLYLGSVLIMGIVMLTKAKTKPFKLFGIMAIVLASGDAFHLIPRSYALLTDGIANHPASLGFGKLVTSITMTAFYLLLYHFWCLRYKKPVKTGLTAAIYALALTRIGLCLFPQNDWLSADAPLSWGIYRNIPFLIMGIIIIVLFFQQAKIHEDKDFRFAWLAITLSFLLYIPVVLWADQFPLVGTLMIPKTIAYVWIIVMGFRAYQKPALL